MIDINVFLNGYIECALWAEGDYYDEDGTDYFKFEDEFDKVSDACKAAMLSDCEDFISANRETLEAFKYEANCDDWRLGVLFWLNRSGHGSGYWDECNSGTKGDELGEKLSDAAKIYSTFDLFGDFEMKCVRSHHFG
jgi:hypothetical protein